jgi:hypothetical protein
VKTPGTLGATQDVLEQGAALLAGLDQATYAQVAAEPFSASIGGHYRHVLDHFLCVAAGIENSSINYDHRSRDQHVESNKAYAQQMTGMLLDTFRALHPQQLDQTCEVVYTVGYDSEPTRINTTVARELAFCVSHAVHHFAIIRLLCAHWSVPVMAELGVAPSTLRYRSEQTGG